MSKTLFNLIAVLYNEIININDTMPHNSISKEDSDFLEAKTRYILRDIFSDNKSQLDGEKCVDSHVFDDIISDCKKEDDYLVYRSVLCQLDSMIDISGLIHKHNFNNYDNGISSKVFNSLNTNVDETGITILPNVVSCLNTFYVKSDLETKDIELKDANYWYDNINDRFQNIICIQNTKLKGYKINNVILDYYTLREKSQIIIGATPICNISSSELLNIKTFYNKVARKELFSVDSYLMPEFLTERFKKAISLSRAHNVDILIGPEMLGSSELCKIDELGYNRLFRSRKEEVNPFLIVTPSFWHDGKNYVSIFTRTGELVGNQYKQNAFEHLEEGDRFEEGLENTPKEILLIHIPSWGRVTFPICVDLLVADYRDLLVRELKSNIVICPSYSSGIVQFENASGTLRDFGARLVWINSCSALRKHYEAPKSIGKVVTPVISPDDLESSEKNICPECDGKCYDDGCLFTITIQLKSDDDHYCNDIEIKHISNK